MHPAAALLLWWIIQEFQAEGSSVEKIWLQQYPEGVPDEIDPDKYNSLVDIFTQSCELYSERPALSNLGTTLSYAELDRLSRDFAAYLQSQLGLKKGDRLAIMMPNLLQYGVALFGALRAGLIVVNVNPLYTPRELEHQLTDAAVETIVVLENFASTLQATMGKTPVKNVIVTKIGDLYPHPKACLVNFVVRKVKKMIPAWQIDDALHFRKILKAGRRATLMPVEIMGKDIAFLQYTGGTTGVAKGAMLTHRNMVANVEQVFAWVDPVVNGKQEVIITALPLYHIFSLTANLLTFFKFGAENILITNPRDIPGFIKILNNNRFTAITGVNTLFNALLNNSQFKTIDFSELKLALGGGMSVQRAVAERWLGVTGKPLLEGYGLTETSPVVCVNPLNQREYSGSIGVPVPSTDIAIMDEEGNELGVGAEGELCVKGPQVMSGYWRMESESEKVFFNGWLRTGDIATINEQGFVYLLERKKDMILVSGFNVYPNEIEDVIAAHPGVIEVAVVGVPHNISGEIVKAFVVRSDPELTPAKILAHCREELTAYKVPKQVEFCDELPKSNVGKILRRSLRESTSQKAD